MNFKDISIPEIYKESQDFRFFLEWFSTALSKIKYDTENVIDLYDPLRCPTQLLWMLADTMGFKYDDRLSVAFNRLVLVYFMSMIRNKGSKDGVTLAAEVNLAQFNLQQLVNDGYTNDNGDFVPPNPILEERLEDTSIPVNAVNVTPHTSQGYIDIVYFSIKIPTDACIEYVRPLGMYLFQYAGVRFDARTKVAVEARLTNTNDIGISIGPTHVGHYRREDYARLQKMTNEQEQEVDPFSVRNPVYYRNSVAEGTPDLSINPGYRAMYSLQIANNSQIVNSLLAPIFDLGYGPLENTEVFECSSVKPPFRIPPVQKPEWNLRYNRSFEEGIKDVSLGVQQFQRVQNDDGTYDLIPILNKPINSPDVYTITNSEDSIDITKPKPAVNPIMFKIGDAISIGSERNTEFTKVNDDGEIIKVDGDGNPVN